MKKLKLLFLLRKNLSSGGYNYGAPKAGLYNSARMTAKTLEDRLNVNTKLEIVMDGNSIDKAIHSFKPDFCVLEAIWVTPAKLRELVKLHPKVHFIIRVHSEVPFLTNEGMAIQWIKEYALISNVTISFNSLETTKDFKEVMKGSFKYLPNLYEETKSLPDISDRNRKVLDIGCFGAIRPLKNQLMQAFAAMAFVNDKGKKLRFHINGSRVEQGGESTLKNLRNLFVGTKHELVEHDWMEREKFLQVISNMDLGMQLSFTESFNIVTADFVSQGVPIIVSETVSWMPEIAKAKTDNIQDIKNKLEDAYKNRLWFDVMQTSALKLYSEMSLGHWKRFIYVQ